MVAHWFLLPHSVHTRVTKSSLQSDNDVVQSSQWRQSSRHETSGKRMWNTVVSLLALVERSSERATPRQRVNAWRKRVAGHTHTHTHTHRKCVVCARSSWKTVLVLVNSKEVSGVSSATRLDPRQDWLLLIGGVLSLLHAEKGRQRPRRGNGKPERRGILSQRQFVSSFASNLCTVDQDSINHPPIYNWYSTFIISEVAFKCYFLNCILTYLYSCIITQAILFFLIESCHTCQIQIKTHFCSVFHFVAGKCKIRCLVMTTMWSLLDKSNF